MGNTTSCTATMTLSAQFICWLRRGRKSGGGSFMFTMRMKQCPPVAVSSSASIANRCGKSVSLWLIASLESPTIRLTRFSRDAHVVQSATLYITMAWIRRPLRMSPPTAPDFVVNGICLEDALILLFGGRLVPEKNPLFAVEVLANLRWIEPRAFAVFVGSGSQEQDVLTRARKLGIESSVRLLGWRNDLAEIMSCSDWFILPHPDHPAEGFGLAIVEAQLAGLRMLLSYGILDDPLLPTAKFRRLTLSEGPDMWAKAAMELLTRSGAVASRCTRCARRIGNEHGPGAQGTARAPHMKQVRPIRVLQIIDSLGMGGAETWLMEVLRLWSKSGVGQIDFLATSGNPGIFDEEARRLGAQVYYLRYGRAHLRDLRNNFAICCGSGGTTPSTTIKTTPVDGISWWAEARCRPCE